MDGLKIDECVLIFVQYRLGFWIPVFVSSVAVYSRVFYLRSSILYSAPA